MDAARDYLAVRTAMIAAGSQLAMDTKVQLAMEAWGNSGSVDAPTGGFLGRLLDLRVKESQKIQRVRPVHWTRAALGGTSYYR